MTNPNSFVDSYFSKDFLSVLVASTSDWIFERALRLSIIKNASEVLRNNSSLFTEVFLEIEDLVQKGITSPNALAKFSCAVACLADTRSLDVQASLRKIGTNLDKKSLAFEVLEEAIRYLDSQIVPTWNEGKKARASSLKSLSLEKYTTASPSEDLIGCEFKAFGTADEGEKDLFGSKQKRA